MVCAAASSRDIRRATWRSGRSERADRAEVRAGADDDLGADLAQPAYGVGEMADGVLRAHEVGHVVGADHDHRDVRADDEDAVDLRLEVGAAGADDGGVGEDDRAVGGRGELGGQDRAGGGRGVVRAEAGGAGVAEHGEAQRRCRRGCGRRRGSSGRRRRAATVRRGPIARLAQAGLDGDDADRGPGQGRADAEQAAAALGRAHRDAADPLVADRERGQAGVHAPIIAPSPTAQSHRGSIGDAVRVRLGSPHAGLRQRGRAHRQHAARAAPRPHRPPRPRRPDRAGEGRVPQPRRLGEGPHRASA